ncbi:MAG: Fur family transcriptional regulator [Planctomycetota bacterium]|jgi:Fur family peroxide stress response transcriptional regulator
MNNRESTISSADLENKTVWFIGLCRERGLKVTPQRIAIYRELVKTNEHPSAEMLCEKVRQTFPSISLDTVNRTLLTLNNIGAAFIVEGSGDAKRFDGGLDEHQHFKCVKCKRVIDFSHEPFNNIEVPQEMEEMFVVLRKSVYLEGICDLCR